MFNLLTIQEQEKYRTVVYKGNDWKFFLVLRKCSYLDPPKTKWDKIIETPCNISSG